MIPRTFHRTVPEVTSADVERFWRRFSELHPGWEFRTHREPLAPEDWPRTAPYWDLCGSGAQKAGLIRLEILLRDGGIYVDSDIEPFRSFEALLPLHAFAGWEDSRTVPDALIGARPSHPAIASALELAIERLAQGGGAWETGPGVTTTIFPGRVDVLLLPPGAFYPYHYTEKEERENDPGAPPYVYAVHHWAHSWASSPAAAVDPVMRATDRLKRMVRRVVPSSFYRAASRLKSRAMSDGTGGP